MDAAVICILTVLNGLVATVFGWYSSFSFAKQSDTRNREVTASFFRLNDYVKKPSLASYRKAFSLLVSLAVFCVLEILAVSPGITHSVHDYLLEKVIELVGKSHAQLITDGDLELSPSVLPFVTGLAGLALFSPQLKFCLSKCREAFHRLIDFKGNAQRMIDDVYVAIAKSANVIENDLAKAYPKRMPPRPRELTSDPDYLARYQLLYYASLTAPTKGLDDALNGILLNVFKNPYQVKSKIQFFDFNKITIAIVIYAVFASLYLAYVPNCSFVSIALRDYFHLAVPVTWPNNDANSLTIELVSYSLQIAATLMYGLAFYELTYLYEPDNVARNRLLGRTVSAQLIFGLIVGLAFHVITVWRTRSGDAPHGTRIFDYLDLGLLGQALAPSLIAPILLCIWAALSNSWLPRGVLALVMAVVGGGLLGFFQFTYEFNHPPRLPGEYYTHEFLFGFCIVLVCLIIHGVGTLMGDINSRSDQDEAVEGHPESAATAA
jgi:hypothetical protein